MKSIRTFFFNKQTEKKYKKTNYDKSKKSLVKKNAPKLF